jgi:hypothetical protein
MEERQGVRQLKTGYKHGGKTGSKAAADRIHKHGGKTGSKAAADRIHKHGGKTGTYAAADRIQRGRRDREATLCSCGPDTSREERRGAMQLRTGYREGGKTGELSSCRQDTSKEERQGTVQLQTGYEQGGKTGSYAAADWIQARRKDRELCSCTQDTSKEDRQGTVQLQTGYNQRGKTEAMQCREVDAELYLSRQSICRKEGQCRDLFSSRQNAC